MDQRRLSAAALGRAIGVSKGTVVQWRNGHREPTTPLIRQLAVFFKVPPAELAALLRRPGE